MPTEKQRKAARIMAENGGNASKAMREAGYSAVTAATPGKLTNSKGFRELLDEYLPEQKLLQVHKEGLDAKKVISARVTSKEAGVDTDDFIEVPDHPTRHKFLETGYQLRGKLRPEAIDLQFNVLIPVVINRVQDNPTEEGSNTQS